MDFDREQKQLLQAAQGFDRTNSYRGEWNKFKGDVAIRLVMGALKPHLPPSVKLVGPPVYVDGCGSELDLIVVDKPARPVRLTSAYPRDQVRLIIEVKYGGLVWWTKRELKPKLREYQKKMRDRLPKKPILWIALREYPSYFEGIRKVLGSNVFILANWKWQPVEGEWKRFAARILSFL